MTIESIAGVTGALYEPAKRIGAPAPLGAVDFGQALSSVGESLEAASALGQQVATGEITDIHQFTAAAAKAQLGVELTVAFRNRAVESFQEIMRMQV